MPKRKRGAKRNLENLKLANEAKKRKNKNKVLAPRQPLLLPQSLIPPLPFVLVPRKGKKLREQREFVNENNIISKRSVFLTITRRSICPDCLENKFECKFTNRHRLQSQDFFAQNASLFLLTIVKTVSYQ